MLAKTIYNVKGLHFQDVNITKKRGMWAFVNSAVQATVRSSIRKKKNCRRVIILYSSLM